MDRLLDLLDTIGLLPKENATISSFFDIHEKRRLQRVYDKLISDGYQDTHNWLRIFLLGDINQRQKQVIGELYQHYSNFMHYYSGRLDNFYAGWVMLLNQISTKEDMIKSGYPPEEEPVAIITLEDGYAVLIKTEDGYCEIPSILPFKPNLQDVDVRNAYFIAFFCLTTMTEISKHFPEMIAVGDPVLVGMYDDQYKNRKTTATEQESTPDSKIVNNSKDSDNTNTNTEDSTPDTFENLLKVDDEQERKKVMESLRSHLRGKRGREVATAIMALEDMEHLTKPKGGLKKIHALMTAQFGDIGSYPGVNDFYRKNKSHSGGRHPLVPQHEIQVVIDLLYKAKDTQKISDE